ncbi:GIY-YIG nuclease family protein [Ruficoccus amylovorans]|uniref:GIY-YIG nuclease family protein n=1 Tax=Ruficoccus amylovorans TaxID=1804625 RepID=A0A842HGC0_9BACT|nr:GIY-YIG nuclease family protein [Ruficoccus amylovorans]MBC2594676.1 GIY-YIG nuclease family protein [Ruficoccus amylovorans]
MRLKRRNDSAFPSEECIRKRFDNKNTMASRVMEFCDDNPEFSDVVEMCRPLASNSSERDEQNNLKKGHVYLLKHDRDYKIGHSFDATQRYKQIRVQMPLETEEIHVIETDDCVGIEKYWHNRFENKRLNGEWFRLSRSDVTAFKKRKFM